MRLLITAIALSLALTAAAQEEEHYTKEFGVALGTGFMLNDAYSRPYQHNGFSGGAFLKFLINPRMAVKTMVTYNMVSGDLTGVKNFYPATTDASTTERLQASYKGGVTDLSATYELNFLPYGYYRGYQNYRRFTPYIQFGLGLTYGDVDNAFTANIPLGCGLKWKAGPRVNIVLDWTMHLSLSDRLEGVKAPTGIASDMFRNKDHYGQTLVTISYDFSKKCPACQRANN